MKEALQEIIDKSLCEYSRQNGITLEAPLDYDLNISKDFSHGDFACNVAFKLARLARQKPSAIAEQLIKILQEEGQGAKASGVRLERIEAAGGGFINFYLTKDSLAQVLLEVQKQNQRFGYSGFGQGKKVLVEFVSANPTGPLTIAHGRQAAVGDSLVRILRASGYEVASEYYLNDVGRQMNLLGKSLWVRYQNESGKNLPLPEDGYQGEYLIDIAKELREQKKSLEVSDEKEKLAFFRQYAGESIMKGICKDLNDLDVHFDHYFSEATLYEKGNVKSVFERLTQAGHFYEQDGALWFRSTAFGDDKDRVVRKSSGENTYLAPDMAYHDYKFQRGYQWLINLLGPDHHGYIPRLKAACQALGYDPNALDIRIVQLTTLFRKGQPVRMSTRAGEFVTLRELMDEVGKDATRFFFVARKIESHLDFDLDLAKQKSQDNPVYYLQYAHARIASLLKYANQPIDLTAKTELLKSQEETDLIKKIMDFPNTLIRASQLLEPHSLADYLTELAACFHKFYSAHRIVTEDAGLSKARLLLADSTRIVLRNGLQILGISQPESM